MSTDQQFSHHARLVTRMADATGVDLVEQMQRGKLDSEDLRMMVHRCQGCTHPCDCEMRLDAGGLTATPDYCRNTSEFAALK